jgi:hypothetical protein
VPIHTFSYTPFRFPPSDPFPDGHVTYRPLMIGRLREPTNGNFLTCVVLPDSGADHCVFPLSFLSVLGLDPLNLKMQMTGGVGSMANTTYYANITVEIPIETGVSLVANVLAGFTAGLDAQGLGLLGQYGFFERFGITFDHRARVFHITS